MRSSAIFPEQFEVAKQLADRLAKNTGQLHSVIQTAVVYKTKEKDSGVEQEDSKHSNS